jgi:serine/threonine protein kinase
MSFSIGDKVGTYEIVEKIGKGGMATVYKAYHPRLDRFVAIKVLHAIFRDDESFLKRFTREARVVAKLEHPHIVPIYDFAEHQGHPYLVMRYIDGETLKDRLTEGALSKSELLRISRAIAQALDYAHRQGILHRDIKPSNILLTKGGGVFITDFGLARITQAGESTLSQDMIMGTPQYISPEQAKGVVDLDGRTDIYSFGIMLYEMLTGQVPFQADTGYSIIHSQIFDQPPDPRELNTNISPELADLLLKVLSKEPENRPATAGEVVAELERTLQQLPDEIAPPGKVVLPDSTPPAQTRVEPAAPAPPLPSSQQMIDVPPLPELDKAEGETETAVSPPPPEQAEAKPKKRRKLPIIIGIILAVCLCLGALAVLSNLQDDSQDGTTDNPDTEPTQVVDDRPDQDENPPENDQPVGEQPPPPNIDDNRFMDFVPERPEPRPIDELEPLVEENPENLRLRAELAEAYLQDGRIDEARELVKTTIPPTRVPLPYNLIGEKLMETNHVAVAALVYQVGYERFPDDGRLQNMLMYALIESGQPTRVVEELIHRLEETPSSTTDITIGIGEAYIEINEGNPEIALDILNELIETDGNPYLPETLYLRGLYFAAVGEPDLAIASFEDALSLRPPEWLRLRLEGVLNEMK